MTMKRTISGMIGAGSLAHNRRDFVAENVDPDRVQLNICYKNENLKEVYKELFDDAVERYNVGKRKDRQIANYYEKIRQGKQEKLFHEVIFQIGNREDMAVGTEAGNLAVNVLDEYVKDFQKRNPTLRVFSCYLHQDEATPHLHIDFIPYVTGWKGKGMDTRVSLKQALKSLGFQGGNKHDTELNQWINHEKEVLAEIAKQHGIEWEQKGTHEEHLDVYNFKKKERKKEVQELEQKKIVLNITAKYNSREQGELKPAGIPSVKGFNSRDIGKLTSPFVTEEDVKVNNDYATSLGAIATVMGSISQMTNEGASAWLTWSANLMTAIGTAIPAIEESIGNAVASATQTPVVGWLLAGAAVASVIAAFATMPQFANGGVVDGSSFFGDKILARVNSGEMILNKSQQSNLFNLLDGGSPVKGGAMSGEVEFKISDKALVGVLKQHSNRTNRLR